MPSHLDLLRESGVTVRTRSQWGAQYPTSRYSMAIPGDYLFLHITVTHQLYSPEYRTRVVERIGASRFPNTRMSYSDVLHPGGVIHEGQPLGRRGAHTLNDREVPGFPENLNPYGHALAYVGMEDDTFGEDETETAARWAAAMVLSGASSAVRVLPHRMFAYKACPGDAAYAALGEINRRFRRYVDRGYLPGTEPDPREWDEMATKAEIEDAVRGVVRDELARHGQGIVGRYTTETVITRDSGTAGGARYAFVAMANSAIALRAIRELAAGHTPPPEALAEIDDAVARAQAESPAETRTQ